MAKQSAPNNKKTPLGNPLGNFSSHVITVLLIILALAGIYSLFFDQEEAIPDISISELAKDVTSAKVKSIDVKGDDLSVTYIDNVVKHTKKEPADGVAQTLVGLGVAEKDLSLVSITVKDPDGMSFWLLTILQIFGPLLLVVGIFWFISRQMKGQSMQAFSFGQSKARIIDPNDQSQKVTFKDVAGSKEAQEEFKKNLWDWGGVFRRGVLWGGAPGTGKTLLARAVAGEAKVPFMYLSGSEFVEMFVGVGASRVRDLFKMAKKVAPSIIFVDEIDAVGRHRGGGYGGGNDEREQTLNQILVEMDGFEPNEKVIVMAATNRPDVLDPALLRPGRFDRRVVLELPDLKDREEILTTHSTKRPLAEDVVLHVIAERTPGFSGADLANLMNEAAILAARENRKSVAQFDIIRSIEKVMLGPERTSHVLSPEEKKKTAYHEAGHALVASILPQADPVHKVTIIPRGRAGGYTLKLPLEEKKLQTKSAFLDDIAVSLGGYAAEQLIYNDVTTGPANDMAVATSLARNMVARYGMSDEIGPVVFEDTEHMTPFGVEIGRPYSEEVAARLDREVSRIMREGLAQATQIIITHKKALDGIATKLFEVETLEREEFEKQLVLFGIEPKRKKVGPGLVIAE